MSPTLQYAMIMSGTAAAALTLSLIVSLICNGLKLHNLNPSKGTMALIIAMTAIEAGLELTGTDREARRIFGLGGSTPFSIVTYPYLHFSAAHLIWNVTGLAIAGTVCERWWGTKRTALFIVAATFILGCSALWSGTVDRHWDAQAFGPVVGASVAVCAMLPACAAAAARALTKLSFVPNSGNVTLQAAAALAVIALVCIDYNRFQGTDFEIAGVAHAAAAVLGILPVLFTIRRLNRPAKA